MLANEGLVEMKCHLRVARPVTNLARSIEMYCKGLDLKIVGRFDDHEEFDGAMLGQDEMQYHFEFTYCRTHPVVPCPTKEDLVVLYLEDLNLWRAACAKMIRAGFKQVSSLNPYWDIGGKTFEDQDGYRVVLQNSDWINCQID